MPPPPFCRWLLDQRQNPRLVLVDIGCRDGPPNWLRDWPGRLSGVAVDPDPEEILRLQQRREWSEIRFLCGWVGDPSFEASLPAGHTRAQWRAANNHIWRRTSSAQAQEILRDYVPPGDPGQQTVAPPMHTLDDLTASLPLIDLLKVDTDGHHLEVLESGSSCLKRSLAVSVEVQFQGLPHPRAASFSNIDLLLRNAGFELFDLRLHRHSRAALPAPFWGTGPSPTFGGQTVWGDAFYARDPVAGAWKGEAERLWMLAGIFELAGLPPLAPEGPHHFQPASRKSGGTAASSSSGPLALAPLARVVTSPQTRSSSVPTGRIPHPKGSAHQKYPRARSRRSRRSGRRR